MLFPILAFTAVLLGVVCYCWFLSTQQRGLTRSVEMIERLQEQDNFSRLRDKKAA